LSQDAEEFFVWKHSDLVLSQTCGMPYRTWLHDKVQLVGTPDYGLAGCPAGYYRSAIVVRADDARTDVSAFKDAVFAYNQTFSQSGYAAPFWHLLPGGFWFENRLHTEQHLESARAVAAGRADIASLDAVTWRNIEAFEPFARDLRVLTWTEPTPGLPLITALGNDANLIFEAVKGAIAELDAQDKSLLGIRGIVKISKQDYLNVRNPGNDSALN
ncbi:MAG: PhnD/SsuA/transferrin family substrate-binding protein, partial [Planktotalea arctica]